MMIAAGIAAVVLAAGLVYAFWSRVGFAAPPRWSEAKVQFLGRSPNQIKGDLGELMTAVILTQKGWRQLPSKADGNGHGIDGLFIRHHWLTGHKVLLTETKVNASPFKLHQLSNTKLIRSLGDLYAVGTLDWDTTAAIVHGLKWHSFAVRKEHWHHSLHQGQTTTQHANRHGHLVGRIRRRDTARLMESLTMMLAGLDRERLYVKMGD